MTTYNIINYGDENSNAFYLFGLKIPKPRKFDEDDKKRLIASAISGACATAAGNPLDAVKVRQQISKTHIGMCKTVYQMVKHEGIQPFYRGFAPPTIVKAGTNALFFTLNGYIKSTWINYKIENNRFNENETPKLNLWETTVVGAICGFTLGPFISCAEYVKIQLQTDRAIPGKPQTYKNMIDCTKVCFQTGAVFRGMKTTMWRVAPSWALYLLIYDSFNRHWGNDNVLGNNNPLSGYQSSLRVIIGGSLAGSISWFFSYPIDYVKTAQQSQDIFKWNYIHTKKVLTKPITFSDVFHATRLTYGLRGFYRGIVPCLIRSLPVNMTNFWVYETVLQIQNDRKK